MIPEGRLALVLLVVQGLLLMAVSAVALRLWRGRGKKVGAPPALPVEPLAGPAVSLRPDTRSWPSGPPRIDPKTGPAEARSVGAPTVLIAVPRLRVERGSSGAWAGLEERHGAVWAMADAGRSAAEIAGETGRTAAEVELILALRRRARAAGPGGVA